MAAIMACTSTIIGESAFICYSDEGVDYATELAEFKGTIEKCVIGMSISTDTPLELLDTGTISNCKYGIYCPNGRIHIPNCIIKGCGFGIYTGSGE